ncbi:MAG TPA: helix-turn-helix domain-containing protein, partial [Pseudonocardiaceae bacterium]|nr:helix-turn-helix domain-containing protein [Pseudonocardiaceae bacterium]
MSPVRDRGCGADPAALFHVFADRTRRDIMRRVLAGQYSVSALAAKYDMSFAAVQKHVAVLEKAGLL